MNVTFGISTYHIPDAWLNAQPNRQQAITRFVAMEAGERAAIMQAPIRGEEPMMTWATMPFGFDAAQRKLDADAQAYADKQDDWRTAAW